MATQTSSRRRRSATSRGLSVRRSWGSLGLRLRRLRRRRRAKGVAFSYGQAKATTGRRRLVWRRGRQRNKILDFKVGSTAGLTGGRTRRRIKGLLGAGQG